MDLLRWLGKWDKGKNEGKPFLMYQITWCQAQRPNYMPYAIDKKCWSKCYVSTVKCPWFGTSSSIRHRRHTLSFTCADIPLDYENENCIVRIRGKILKCQWCFAAVCHLEMQLLFFGWRNVPTRVTLEAPANMELDSFDSISFHVLFCAGQHFSISVSLSVLQCKDTGWWFRFRHLGSIVSDAQRRSARCPQP